MTHLLGVYPLFFGQVFVGDTRMRGKLHAVLAVVVLSGRQTLQCLTERGSEV